MLTSLPLPPLMKKFKTNVNYLLITGTKSSECSKKSNSTSFTVKETARRTHAINCERGDAANGICITSFQPLKRHSALLKIPARFLHFPRTSGRNLSIHALNKIQNQSLPSKTLTFQEGQEVCGFLKMKRKCLR